MSSKGSVALFGCIGIIVSVVILVILNGLVLSQLWAWFVVPVLGVPQISIAQAVGLTLIVTYLFKEIRREKKYATQAEWFEGIVFSVMNAGLILLFGYIIQLFISIPG